MHRVTDKIAFVSGAASGLGKQIALTLARAGAIVAVADLNPAGVDTVAQQIRSNGGKAVRMALDVTDESAVTAGIDRLVAQFGALDVLVSNARLQIVDPLELYSLADWRKMQAVHVDSAFLTTRAALKHMYRNDRGGTVIYTDSTCARGVAPPRCAEVVARHALLGLAEVVAREGRRHNVSAYLVCAGPALRRMPPREREAGLGDVDVARRVIRPAIRPLMRPMKALNGATQSFANKADIAATVLMLAGCASRLPPASPAVVARHCACRDRIAPRQAGRPFRRTAPHLTLSVPQRPDGTADTNDTNDT